MKFIKDLDPNNLKIDPNVDENYQNSFRDKLAERFVEVHYVRSRPGWELFLLGSLPKKNARLGKDYLLLWHNMGTTEFPELAKIKIVLIIPNSGEIKKTTGGMRVSRYQAFRPDANLMLHNWLMSVLGYVKKYYPNLLAH